MTPWRAVSNGPCLADCRFHPEHPPSAQSKGRGDETPKRNGRIVSDPTVRVTNIVNPLVIVSTPWLLP